MNTREMEIFNHLARSLHFAKTGEAMHLSASAVSRTVQRLEEELGVALFERDNRRVALTTAGQEVLQYSKQALANWQGLLSRLNQSGRELAGELSVYCSVTAAYAVLGQVLETFRNRYPRIELKLHTGDQADSLERVVAGEEDIAITARPEHLHQRLAFQVLTHSPLRLIAPAVPCVVAEMVAEAQGDGRLPWDRLPVIMSERGVARLELERWFRLHGIRPNVYAQVSGHEAIASMVALGLGVGVVPELVLAHSPVAERLRVLPLADEMKPLAVGVCTLKQRLDNPLIEVFWQVAASVS
ncbi:LysR family positive regulator for ilvC [Litorivivens lipolytica]|uniref:LysR family positive regulator for ilvC n=1 Tax=Litorivivens lipolytica TaxID=1524264 RepID=A0A7W4W7F4_9GAMM|nr:HTH-type transcriptional activator IlvY [Litorivivens lipolytica]MBB3048861.1 LysR family positive regulator for ilvC [Litorivivens lipolytica]